MMIYLSITIFIPFMCKFSYTASKACDIQNEAVFINVPDTESDKEVPLCPAESKNIEEKPTQHSELNYCLFKKTVPKKGLPVCDRDVKPVLYIVKDENEEPVRCGSEKNQFLHNFGYFYCQKMNKDQLREMDTSKLAMIDDIWIKYIVTYTVCYDISKSETIWTRHQVLALFKGHYFIDEEYCPTKISTDPFYKNSEAYFQNLKNKFDEEKEDETTNIHMLPQLMVPAKHFALRTWKKTTNHYINVAPLWEELVLLMDVIDEGIHKAAKNVYLDAIDSNTPHDGLVIYTTTKSSRSAFSWEERFQNWISKFFVKTDRFESNVWYKFVYDPMTQQGIMIHVYNIPGKKVDNKLKKKDLCNFKHWADDKDTRDKITSYLLVNYAYCSKVTSRDIRKLFHTDLKIDKKVLDIQSLSTS